MSVPAPVCRSCELHHCHACEELTLDPLHDDEVVPCACRHDTRRTA